VERALPGEELGGEGIVGRKFNGQGAAEINLGGQIGGQDEGKKEN
jgi:hypothetical protein